MQANLLSAKAHQAIWFSESDDFLSFGGAVNWSIVVDKNRQSWSMTEWRPISIGGIILENPHQIVSMEPLDQSITALQVTLKVAGAKDCSKIEYDNSDLLAL